MIDCENYNNTALILLSVVVISSIIFGYLELKKVKLQIDNIHSALRSLEVTRRVQNVPQSFENQGRDPRTPRPQPRQNQPMFTGIPQGFDLMNMFGSPMKEKDENRVQELVEEELVDEELDEETKPLREPSSEEESSEEESSDEEEDENGEDDESVDDDDDEDDEDDTESVDNDEEIEEVLSQKQLQDQSVPQNNGNDYSDKTVNELKKICQMYNLRVSGNKTTHEKDSRT